ncbi:hypothetical protein V6N11_034387 [Hibiscus sabdariffa]|uniref:Uncharacterized protein n=1 Tax=Hibiscus sabdariffa TaxID=183260 RepID=A0ABR1ZBL8_9ROSI
MLMTPNCYLMLDNSRNTILTKPVEPSYANPTLGINDDARELEYEDTSSEEYEESTLLDEVKGAAKPKHYYGAEFGQSVFNEEIHKKYDEFFASRPFIFETSFDTKNEPSVGFTLEFMLVVTKHKWESFIQQRGEIYPNLV